MPLNALSQVPKGLCCPPQTQISQHCDFLQSSNKDLLKPIHSVSSLIPSLSETPTWLRPPGFQVPSLSHTKVLLQHLSTSLFDKKVSLLI